MNTLLRDRTINQPKGVGLNDGLFIETGVLGVFGRTRLYESVVEGLQRLISAHADPDAEVLRFPPVMSRKTVQRAGYLKSFPHFLGCVCSLTGSEAQIRSAVEQAGQDRDLGSSLEETDVALTPAACYPVYPIAASRGPVGEDGLLFDVASDCFRREPSTDIDRLQSFRMREFVRIGGAEQIVSFRDEWIERGRELAEQLGLSPTIEQASDPFFGRGGQLTAITQIQQSLKFELLLPVRTDGGLTACMSFNYHRSHFCDTWGIVNKQGDTLHTGCVAFGIDRLALALFSGHGLTLDQWPARLRSTLNV